MEQTFDTTKTQNSKSTRPLLITLVAVLGFLSAGWTIFAGLFAGYNAGLILYGKGVILSMITTILAGILVATIMTAFLRMKRWALYLFLWYAIIGAVINVLFYHSLTLTILSLIFPLLFAIVGFSYLSRLSSSDFGKDKLFTLAFFNLIAEIILQVILAIVFFTGVSTMGALSQILSK